MMCPTGSIATRDYASLLALRDPAKLESSRFPCK
jgi:hypothetical protein